MRSHVVKEQGTVPAVLVKSYNNKEISSRAPKESLVVAKSHKVGPRTIDGLALKDVEALGNCFYDAVIHQMGLINHLFLKNIPDGTAPKDSLRLSLQGADFKDREYAGEKEVHTLLQKHRVIVAIVDTRYPKNGFVYHYINEEGRPDFTNKVRNILQGRPIIKLAYTGNHYLSVLRILNQKVSAVGLFSEKQEQKIHNKTDLLAFHNNDGVLNEEKEIEAIFKRLSVEYKAELLGDAAEEKLTPEQQTQKIKEAIKALITENVFMLMPR